MFRIHKEGYVILIAASILILLVNLFFYKLTPSVFPWFAVASLVLLGVILQFFRNPRRPIKIYDNKMVYAPADGKVVVIEQIVEDEYFKDKRIQISIFMSPFNVHVNRNPIGGIVSYYRYHRGKYLVAWHPKSSTENERTTVVVAQD
ncbi:MAG: phosphatidylserine decarboxylase family protein, partial [Saprospiraceae bacterium]|nr:phosphatidylserine decarboxylase family protein [Saprospiraceae bacterium]